MAHTKIEIFCDGGARGNPGPAAIGFSVSSQDGQEIHSHSQPIGRATNNVAEYQAVIAALDWLLSQKSQPPKTSFFLDSTLVVNQITGNFKTKDKNLQVLNHKVQQLIKKSSSTISFTYVPRDRNQRADALVNAALDSL